MANRIQVLALIFIALLGFSRSLQAQGDPFWYPQQATVPYSIHAVPAQQFHLHSGNAYQPQPVFAPQVLQPTWHQTITSPYPAVTPIYEQQGILTVEPMIDSLIPFDGSGTTAPLSTGNVLDISEQSLLEPNGDQPILALDPEIPEPPKVAPPVSADEGPESPLDMEYRDMERLAQREAAQRMLQLDDQVQGLAGSLEAMDDKTTERLDAMEKSIQEIREMLSQVLAKQKEESEDVIEIDDEDSTRKALEELESENGKLKAELDKKIQARIAEIRTLQTKIREMEESREAARAEATHEDIARLQADLKKAIASVRARPEGESRSRKDREQLKRQLDQIAEIVEREVQDSIREEKERIIRSVIRRATKEMKDRDDRDRCDEDRNNADE